MNFDIGRPWKFFFLTFSWSWIIWTLCIVLGFSLDSSAGTVFYILGALAPSLIGILLARFDEEKGYWEDFKNRITDFGLIERRWYLVIFGLIPITILAAFLMNYLANNPLPNLTILSNYLMNPLSLLGFGIATLIGGPLIEEMGWRGYALDHLIENGNLIRAALIVTLFWTVWHWPLFLIEGTLQSALIGESFASVLIYNVEIFSYGILIVWIYNNTDRSILSAILFHFSINFFAGITNFSTEFRIFETIVQLTMAIAVLVYWKSKENDEDSL